MLGNAFKGLYGKKGTHKRKYREFPSQLNQNIAFWSGMTDVIIVDLYIFNYYTNMLGNDFNTDQKLDYHNLFPNEIPQYVAFKDKKLRDEFNDALKQLRYDGTYNAIVNRSIITK